MATMFTKMSPDDIREAIKKAETVLAKRNSIKTLSETARVLVDTLVRIDAFCGAADLCAERADVVSTLNRLLEMGADPQPSGWLAATLRYIAKDYNGYLTLIRPVIRKLLANGGAIGFEEAEDKFLRIFNNINVDDEKKAVFKKFHDENLPQKYHGSAFGLYVWQKASRATTFNVRQKNLQNVIDADSKWFAAHKELGTLCYNNKKWGEAADYWEIATKKSDVYKSADIYCDLGMACFKDKQWERSEKAFRRCFELDEQYQPVDNYLGLCLFHQKRYAEAITWFDRYIEQGTDDVASTYLRKFDALEKLGRTEDLLDFVKSNPSYFCEKEKYRKKIIEMDGGMEVILGSTTESKSAGRIKVLQSNSAIQLYPHQRDAIQEMHEKIPSADSFAGILVLPTGGGKTLTATYWLMRDILDNDGKVIWLAHRDELLNQARDSFKKVCYSDITQKKSGYNYRLVSGLHDKPVKIETNDDIIIASKASLYRGKKYLEGWLKANGSNVFLVIDEAHHATASEYYELIDYIRKCVKHLKMLGLTATPFRTADNEQGLLQRIFKNGNVYEIDLQKLISRGILSTPILKSVNTGVNMKELFNKHNVEAVLSKIVNAGFDLDTIGEETANIIANHSPRNNAIVDEYFSKRDVYNQTLVFALNVTMALALSALFKAKGVKADYVVSSVKDMHTGVTVSGEDNKRKIDEFRKGKLEVLINVNILTEGVDLPQVQSVFLTRPTKSKILMTQMIGRALRGEKAGGTKEAYIVSFIDDWRDRIAWVTPQQLIDIDIDFKKKNDKPTREHMRTLISIAKIEEFAKRADDTLDHRITDLPFEETIPVGVYQFKYLIKAKDGSDGGGEKYCNILVFNCTQKAYEEFLTWLQNETITDADVEEAANHVDTTQFGTTTTGRLLGYRKQDIIDIINYYKEKGEVPTMIEFAERDQYDISSIAKDIVKQKLDSIEKYNLIDREWKRSDNYWSAFFGISNQRAFSRAIDDAIHQIVVPKSPVAETPLTVNELIKIQDLPVYEIKQRFPDIGEKLIADVYSKFTDADGYYYSAQSGYRSKCRLDFQIDHKNPMSKGGKTVPDNLQLLKREENWIKSDR